MNENRRSARGAAGAVGATRGDASPAATAAKTTVALLLVAAAAYGAWWCFSKLRSSWLEQCVVTDVRSQVTVHASQHVSEDIVLGLFSLTNGCNLALMDLDALREKILAEQPLVKSLAVTRRLPGRLVIDVEERKPVARVNYVSDRIRDSRGITREHGRWDVVDADGVVFNYKRDDSKLLPRIVEPRPTAKRGERLAGKTLSAVRLIDLCSRKEFASIGLLDVDVSNGTYLVAATSKYDVIRIPWTMLDDPADRAQPKMRATLAEIAKAAEARLSGEGRIEYIATEPGRVVARPYSGGNQR